MREILFRGKRSDTGEWIYGDLLHNVDAVKIREQEQGIQRVAKSFVVIPETVGQFTGLFDKNGRKIFENGYMIIDNKTYKVIFDNAEYILTNIFDCDIITLKNNSIKGVFVDEI